MMCPGDMDASYVQEIIKVKSIESIGNEFNWKNSEGKVIMMAQKLNRWLSKYEQYLIIITKLLLECAWIALLLISSLRYT